MVSASIREFPVLARQTRFDLGEARVISIDLDEVAKGGGDSADRQTAVMYMLSRYIMAKNYYLTRDNLPKLDDNYVEYHQRRIDSISKSHKRIVYDEFHRTANADAVRAQVVQDMREGRKWNVQVALISQSLDDFDQVMVEFATSVFILDAGPEQAVAKTVKVFGLSDTARHALKQSVHGPRSGGSTLLAQFATNSGMNVQLLTLTLGPIELWAFSTSAHDSIIRNALYGKIGPKAARKVLAGLFPSGSASKYLEFLSNKLKEDKGVISEKDQGGILDGVLRDIIEQYRRDPDNIVLQGLY
jgi:intracellular multiplication protein IcmB